MDGDKIIDLAANPEQFLAQKTLLEKYAPKLRRSPKAEPRKPGHPPGHSLEEPKITNLEAKEANRRTSNKVRLRMQLLKSARHRLKTLRGMGNIEDQCLFNSLMRRVVSSSRGERSYTRTLAELIASVGNAPSSGGARAPLAGIIAHATGGLFYQFVHQVPFNT